jgi:phosphoglycolate phosphatase
MCLSDSIRLTSYSAFLFDFDYTLADSSEGILECFRIVFRRHHWENIPDEMIKSTIGMTMDDSFSFLTGIKDKEILASLKAEYRREADEIMTDNTQLYPDAVSFVKWLKQHGMKTGIVSTKTSRRIREAVDRYRINGLFDMVVGMEDVQAAKPDPEGIFLSMRRLDVSPEQTLYFGDSIIDAKTAEAAGTGFIGVTTGVTSKEKLQKFPHLQIVASLAELL